MTGLEQIGPMAHGHWAALVAALTGLGLGVGVLTGLVGAGGALIVTPLMNVVLGIPYPVCVGSSLSFAIGTSASAWARHVRLGNYEPRTTAMLGLGALAGVWAGVQLNALLAHTVGGGATRAFTLVMHGMFIAVLLLAAWLMAWSGPGGAGRRPLFQRLALPPRIALPAAGIGGVCAPAIVLAGVGIGMLNGMLGIGGGVMFMPLLILLVGLTPHQAVGTSLGAVLINSLLGTALYGIRGDATLLVVMPLLVGSTLGVQVGAWLCHRLHPKHLKAYAAGVVVVLAAVIAADVAWKIVRH
jgi:uncharacterized protein